MPQTTDVVLAGRGYMVAPGSYRRQSEGLAQGRSHRVVMRDFFGGQHRALQLERDRGWDGLSVHSCYGGQGVEPWPQGSAIIEAGISPYASFALGRPCPHLVMGTAGSTRAYAWINGKLYRCPVGNSLTWPGLEIVADLSGLPGHQLAYYNAPGTSGGDRIAVALGGNTDIRLIDPSAAPGSNVSTFKSGERASAIVGYGGVLVYAGARADDRHRLYVSDGTDVDSFALDSPIVRMSLHQGSVAVATRFGLWLLDGKWVPARAAVVDPETGKVVSPRVPASWQGDPEPFFSSGFWTNDDDYGFLVSYGGKLYTWLAHQVMEYDPGNGNQRQGWRSVGLEGVRSYGGCVAGGHLIVAIETWRGETETWAFDGSGWWLIARRTTGQGTTPCWPLPTAGAGNTDLLVFRDRSESYDLYRLIPRGPSTPSYAAFGTYTTSLLDGGERDQPKAWRFAGAEFAAPEPSGNAASTDPVTVTLQISVNGGATWTTIATATPTSAATRTLSLRGAVPESVPMSTFVQIRVSWSSVSDWAPVLAGLWAEYETLDTPIRRRRWQFTVHARDDTVHRTGGREPRTGAQLATDLWAAWVAGDTITFRDLDADETGVTYRARIVGIDEEIARPADQPRGAQSVVRLTLVEV